MPLRIRITDGTSAQLTNQSLPDATVRGADHPALVRSAKRRLAFGPSRSIQLRITPREDVESCGWALFAPAGDGSASIDGVHAAVDRSCRPINVAVNNAATMTTPLMRWRIDTITLFGG